MIEVNPKAVLSLVPNETHVDKEGYLVRVASGKAALSASATVEADGVILDGEATTGKSSVALLGGNIGLIRMKLTGAVSQGGRLIQHTDGTVKADTATGARVVVAKAIEDGVDGELVAVLPCTPIVYTS